MAIPLSKQKLSADYGVTLSRGAAPQLADGTKVGGTTLTAAKFTAYDAALAGVVPVASAVYDAVTDFTAGAATVPDEVRGVTVDITDGNTALTLTLPTGATNLGDVLTLTVDLDGANPGTLDVVCGGSVTLPSITNGQHTFHCTGTGIWKPMRNAAEILALQSDVEALETSVDTAGTGLLDRTTALETYVDALQPVTAITITDITTAHEAYTVPDRVSALILNDENTILEDQIDAVITLPTGANNIGQKIGISVTLGSDANKHTVNVYLGSINGTLVNLADGNYGFYCIAAGQWTRELVPTSGGLTDFGPNTFVSGDISAYNETAFKALLTACAKAGIIADTTTT